VRRRRHAKLFVLVLVLESVCRGDVRLERTGRELDSMAIRNAGNFSRTSTRTVEALTPLTLDGARQQSSDEKPSEKDIDQRGGKRGRDGSRHHDVPVHGIRSLEIV
jgi:hypothetical protein